MKGSPSKSHGLTEVGVLEDTGMICYCSKVRWRRRLRKREEGGGMRRLGRCPVTKAVRTAGSLLGQEIERGKQIGSVF